MKTTTRVLYVDDNLHDRALVQDALEKETTGFKVITVRSRAEFEAQLARGEFDLVLTDFNILGFEGLQVLKAVKKQRPEVPVIIVTGTGSEEVAIEAMKLDAADYVIKTPHHIQRLPFTIHAALENKRLQIEREQAVEKERRHFVQTKALRKVVEKLNRANTLQDIYSAAIEGIRKAIQADRASVLLVDPDGIARFKAWYRLSAGYRKATTGHFPWQLHDLKAKPITLPEISCADLPNELRATILNEGIQACSFIPLIATDRLLGKFMTYYDAPHTFKSDEMNLGKVLADNLTTAIERKQGEEALRQSEEKYRTLFETSKDAIFFTTLDGKFIDINSAGVKLLGYASKEELLQTDIPQNIYADPKDRSAMQKVFKKQGFVKDYEVLLKKKNGKEIYVLETATLVRDKQGNRQLIQGILRDLTAQKKLEAQLLHAQKMETIGLLAGGIAHDFNNLLMAILGNAEMALRELKPAETVYQDIIQIIKATNRASDLSDQLLSFSRRKTLKKQYINLNTTIEDLLQMLRRILGEDIELNVRLSPEIAALYADPGQIQQVLMNLFVNARDAMPKGGNLLLRTDSVKAEKIKNQVELDRRLRNYVQVTITDTGKGMENETLSHIFEPFFTTKEVGKGTGLGLPVVFGIMKQHEGHIEVVSEVGKGTTFKLFFPAVTDAETARQEKKKEAVVRGGGETVLIVEDDEAVRSVSVRILNGLSYTSLMAKDGAEALNIFKAEKDHIALVIMDIVMPGEGGPEIYNKMSALKPDLPVLFVTGYNIEAEVSKLSDLSKQELIDVLQKPYTRETLSQKVQHLLKK